jgi:hypothetical protein
LRGIPALGIDHPLLLRLPLAQLRQIDFVADGMHSRQRSASVSGFRSKRALRRLKSLRARLPKSAY